MSLIFWGVFICVLAGAVVWGVTTFIFPVVTYAGRKRITKREFIAASLVCALVLVPAVVLVGRKVALDNNLKYKEFWNGYEVKAIKDVTECRRDGSCRHEYNCDPYTVLVTRTRSVPDGKGGTRTETYTETETRYHDCPYATEEWDFNIETTLGDFHIERTFPTNAQRFRSGKGLKSGVRQGVPPFWQAAYDRIKAGDPGPVTVRKSYDNYILASQSSILKEFSAAVEKYQAILPAPAKEIRDFYYANKAYFIGVKTDGSWTNAVMRFNAAFGSDLQGDLHVVLVDEDKVENPDEFAGALNAHWTGKAFGRNALSKNALVIVLGTDGETVTWVRSFTGMPLGNESLLADIQRELEGLPLDAEKILGRPVGVIDGDDVTIRRSSPDGLESLVWGPNKFERVCMTCEEEGGGGFGYLGGEIEPSGGQRFWILFTAFFLSLLVWAGVLALGSERR